MSAQQDIKFIEKIIEVIDSEYEHAIVPVIAEPYSIESDCFYNVPKKVAIDGGSIVYGWSVLLGGFLCEAERHAVWLSPNGELIDITKNTHQLTHIIFIPQDLEYHGQLINNIRLNSTDNKVVDDWILVNDILGTIKGLSDNVRVGNKMILNFSPDVNILYKKYDHYHNLYFTFLKYYNGKENTKCFCGSDKEYHNCHRISIIEWKKRSN